MGEPLILEITDHRGRLRFRARLAPYGTSIGRGYRNDVILDDPYVDATHLRIAPTANGELAWRDVGSVNGTWDSRHTHRVETGPVTAGLELRVGRSTIRFLSPDQAVPAAVHDPTGRRGAAALVEPRRAIAVLAVATVVAAVSQYFASTAPTNATELLTPALASLLLAGVWATAWAFTNRIVAQRFRFPAHWAWTTLLATTFLVTGIGFEWVGFLVPAFDIAWLEVLTWAALGSLLLVGHFQLVTEWSARRQWGVATGVTVVLLVVIGILGRGDGDNESRFRDRVASLKPLASRYIPSTTVDRFFAETADLKEQVDLEAGLEPVAEADSTR